MNRTALGFVIALLATPLLPQSSASATAAVPLDPVTTFACPGGGFYDVDANGVASRGGTGQYLDSTGVVIPAGNCAGNLVLDSSVKRIEEFGFASAPLTAVTLPNHLESIGRGAFSDTQITSLVIPNSVTSIETSAFGLVHLTSLQLGTSVSSIGSSAFREAALTTLVVPNSVTTIGSSAFAGSPLTSLSINSPSLTVGSSAFRAIASSNLSCFYNLGNANLSPSALQAAALPPACVIHRIATTVGPNGAIASTPSYIDDGASPDYVFVPSAGYQVDAVQVDSADVTGSLVQTTDQSRSYTFAPVTTDHTLSVTFKPIPVSNPAPPSTPNPTVAPTPEVSASPTPTATPSPTPTPTTEPVPTSDRPRISAFRLIGFDPGSARVSMPVQLQIAKMASKLAGAKKILLTGYTQGPTVLKVDYSLSLRRAQTIRAALQKILGNQVHISVKCRQSTQVGSSYRAVHISVSR